MRILATTLALGTLLPGAAQAASILQLAPSSADPSIVTLGASSVSPSIMTAGTADPAAARSIVALGNSAPGIAYDNVAAIGDEPQKFSHRPNTTPLVIRGGIVGEAFARDTGSAPSPAADPSAGAPEAAPTPVAASPEQQSGEPAPTVE